MQSDPDNIRKHGAHSDKVINFRPSPNFQNMKRFLKKKIVDCTINETANTLATSSHDAIKKITPDPLPTPAVAEKTDQKPNIQPPLPLYPPPPDTPPPEHVTIKTELVEDYNIPDDNSALNLNQYMTSQPEPEVVKPKKAICKDYIRGNCLRTQCKFAHERDLTQLEGIYTFCWNFQNTGCQITNCKYVHASPFEEGEFYRTGKLPPHALDHVSRDQSRQTHMPPQTQTSVSARTILPPPPPPPPPPPEEPRFDMSMIFSQPPPPLYTPMPFNQPPPMMVRQPPPTMVSEMESRGMDVFRMQQMMCPPPASATPKRRWPEVDERQLTQFNVPIPMLTEYAEQTSECSSCPDMEFRLQYNKSKVEKQIRVNKELKDKSDLLDLKISKLYSVLVTVLKPMQQATSTVTSMHMQSHDEDRVCICVLLSAARI